MSKRRHSGLTKSCVVKPTEEGVTSYVKVEVQCVNQGCLTFGTAQLIKVAQLGKYTGTALDEDGQRIRCDFCNGLLTVVQLSNDESQFPLGKTHMTPLVIDHVAGKYEPEERQLQAAKVLAEFVACHVREQAVVAEFDDRAMLPDGTVVTSHIYDGEQVWVSTNPERTETKIMLAREWPFEQT
jgi:hypothetical protein